jgi:hypothetical protein
LYTSKTVNSTQALSSIVAQTPINYESLARSSSRDICNYAASKLQILPAKNTCCDFHMMVNIANLAQTEKLPITKAPNYHLKTNL